MGIIVIIFVFDTLQFSYSIALIPCQPDDAENNDDGDDDDDDDYDDDDDHPPGWRRPNCTLTMTSAISGSSGLSWFVMTIIKPSLYICIC